MDAITKRQAAHDVCQTTISHVVRAARTGQPIRGRWSVTELDDGRVSVTDLERDEMDCFTRRPDMPEDEYHARPETGSTVLRAALKSRRHYELAKRGIETTGPMRLGTAIHCAALEPGRFEEDYIASRAPIDVGSVHANYRTTAELLSRGYDVEMIAEEVDTKTSTIKRHIKREDVQALAEHWRQYPPDLYPHLSDSDMETVQRVCESLHAHPEVANLLSEGLPEVSLFAEINGVDCKGRVDWLNGGMLDELKTTSSCVEAGAFAKTIARRDLHVQAAMYETLYEAVHEQYTSEWLWIAAETREPYCVEVIRPDMDMMQEGHRLVRIATERIKRWEQDASDYGGYSDTVQQVSLPSWAYRADQLADEFQPAEVVEVPF